MPLMPLQPTPGQPYSPHPADSFVVGNEPINKPFKEAPLRSALAAIPQGSIYCDFIRTICSDADGTSNGEGWAGVQTGKTVMMSDGTLFMWYVNNTPAVKLMRSPTGGVDGPWTAVTGFLSHALAVKAQLLRDASRDLVHFITFEGTTGTWNITIRTYNSAGQQQGSTFTLPFANSRFLRSFQSGVKVRATILNNRVVFITGQGVVSSVSNHLEQQTVGAASVGPGFTEQQEHVIMWAFYDGTTWTFEEPVSIRPPGNSPFVAYDISVIGANGDPDYICGITNQDMRWDELTNPRTGLKGPSYARSGGGIYVFTRVGFWWHNRRTKNAGFKWLTPETSWWSPPGDGAAATFSIPNGSNIMTVQSISRGGIAVGQVLKESDGTTDITGVPADTFIMSPGSAPDTWMLSANTTGLVSSAARSLIAPYSAAHAPERRMRDAWLDNNGVWWITYYLRVPQRPTNTTGSSTSSWRLMRCTVYGEILSDDYVVAPFNGGFADVWVSPINDRPYLFFIGSNGNLSHTGAFEVTNTGGILTHANILAAGNTLHINRDDWPTAGSKGVGCNNAAYLGAGGNAPTVHRYYPGPAYIPSPTSGSKPCDWIDAIVGRGATDWIPPSSGGSTNATNHMFEHVRIRVAP